MKKVIFFTLLILLSTSFAYAQDDTVVCTADAMQCSDGTWVGRTGSNCEFVCNESGEDTTIEIDDSQIIGLPDPVLPCRDEVYEPVCAISPMPKCLVEHTCKMPNPAPTTYSNECFAKHAEAKILYKGKCDEGIDNTKKDMSDDCITWFDGCNTCSRTSTGMMAMCTMMACRTYSEPYCVTFADEEVKPKKVDDNLKEETNIPVNTSKVIGIDDNSGTDFRVINKIQSKKLFGIFSVNLNTKLFVEKDSGQLIKEKKPWYSFLLF